MFGNMFSAAMGSGMGGMPGMPFGGQPQRSPQDEEARQRVLKNIKDFKLRPRDVKAHLDRYVVEQDEAKKVLSVALCDHYNWARRCIQDATFRSVNYTKPNILILGPTGSGKTYLVRTMAKMLGVPFVKADATKFSETGIVGEDAEDVVRGLVESAGGDTELAQYGIVYIDEVDKIANGGRSAGSWSGRQVQSNFLKIMEDTEVSVKNSLQASLGSMFGGGGQGETISTKFMLFIFSGAFNSMNEQIRDRVGKQSMGFLIDASPSSSSGASTAGGKRQVLGDEESRSYLNLAETSDFVQAGLEPEFIGRIPVRVAIDALDANDLYRILTEAEDSILKQYENEFAGYDIELKSDRSALRKVAELAVKEKTGARALVTILEQALRNYKFELPSTPIKELLLTEELIADPSGTLNSMLSLPERAANDIQRWLDEVERQYKVRLTMDDEVRQQVLSDCATSKESAETLLNRRFRSTGVIAGFREIHEATSVDLFSVSMAMYKDPEEQIKKWKQELQRA